MNAYVKRNRVLKRIGFKNYDAYLSSDLWAKIRAHKLRTSPNCYACGKRATQVHHGRYTIDVMLGHSPDHLYSACGGCHYRSEFTADSQKRNVRNATKRLKQSRRYWNRTVTGVALYGKERENVDTDFKKRLERED